MLSCQLWLATVSLAGAEPPQQTAFYHQLIPMVVLIFIAFYFIIFRPQKREQKERQRLLDNLKKGDRVVTIGGVHGEVSEVSDDTVTIRVAPKMEIKFNRSAVSTIVPRGKGKDEEKESEK
ncbi:MAG: preprotein translocase subunit YajC [bacterium]